jgi:hypothetical protein
VQMPWLLLAVHWIGKFFYYDDCPLAIRNLLLANVSEITTSRLIPV